MSGYVIANIDVKNPEAYKEYAGKVIEIQTTTLTDGDGKISTVDSIAGKFQLGEQLVGQTSTAQGKLIKKNTDMNQLIVQNVTKAFLGNMHEPGGVREEIRGAYMLLVFLEMY